MRGAGVSTTYAGAVSDTSAPPRRGPSVADLGAEVCRLVPSPDPAGVYIVFTSNAASLPTLPLVPGIVMNFRTAPLPPSTVLRTTQSMHD